ncbi:MAG: Rrf2 family transcriptional regulator [Clostridiales bacterium]|nr:Rrf2 family transcriptional regulator [Clostridiales bacterium]MCF8021111.1 Rrf2 family transcriptional regulator [Clostridiales bacterium]
MKLSTRGHYGLKAMYDLALNYNNNPVPLKSIARRQNLSNNYLEQLVAMLRKNGLVRGVRGAQGGYVLTKDPADITVGEIIRTLEGPIAPINCVSEVRTNTCQQCNYCIIHILWAQVRDSIAEVLDSTTLADMCHDTGKIQDITGTIQEV